jgi:trk system potassium uptake protein TrkH
MILAGINFGLHFLVFRRRDFRIYWFDSETKTFIWALLVYIGLTFALFKITSLTMASTFDVSQDWVHGLFQVISFATTTGFTSTDYSTWPPVVSTLMLLTAFVGACAASTGGGMKVIRALLLVKQGYREILKLIHPNAVIPIKLGGEPVSDRIFNAVWSFFAIYLLVFTLLFLMVLATGLDFKTAFSAVSASINNLGPGLGDVTYHYKDIPDATKWLLCFAMLVGRLEVFTLLLLLTPAFWKK